MLVYTLPIPWPVGGLHNVLAPVVFVPRPHEQAAQQMYSMITYPSVRARVKVADTAEDPARPEGKLTFPQTESSVLSRRYSAYASERQRSP
jgi:hypothetical protein